MIQEHFIPISSILLLISIDFSKITIYWNHTLKDNWHRLQDWPALSNQWEGELGSTSALRDWAPKSILIVFFKAWTFVPPLITLFHSLPAFQHINCIICWPRDAKGLQRPAHKRKQIGLLARLRKITSRYGWKWLSPFYDLDLPLQPKKKKKKGMN